MNTNNIPSHILPTPSPPPEPVNFYNDKTIATPVVVVPTAAKKQTILLTKRKYISRCLTIVQRLLKELDGRDKIMKIIQYFIKILLHYHLVSGKHFSTITSHFSMTRKLFRLGTGIGPMREISPFKHSLYQTTVLTNTIINHISDDIFCLYKLGVFGSYLGNKSERISAYCWFIGIMFDLRANSDSLLALQKPSDPNEKQHLTLEEKKQKIFMTEVSIIKLLMDGVFCACDIWKTPHSSTIQNWSGFFSGSLAGYKLWVKFSPPA